MGESEVEKLARLDERVKDLEEQQREVRMDLKAIRNYQTTTMGGIIVALILLVINMAIGR